MARKQTTGSKETAVAKQKKPSAAAAAAAKIPIARNLVLRGARSVRKPNRVKALVSMIDQGDETSFVDVLNEFSVSLSFAFSGTGTARSTVLDYLGIGRAEKSVLLCLIPESDEEAILQAIGEKLSLYLVGRGISFTVPLSAVSEIIANGITGAAAEKSVDGSKIMKDENRKYDLIVAAVAAGYVDEAMEAARSAGAAGGTIVRARSVNNQKAEQFIGISLQREQELLLILARREGKQAIMQAVSESAGLKTEAGGVLFSLPVDRTVGVSVVTESGDRKGTSDPEETGVSEAGEGKND